MDEFNSPLTDKDLIKAILSWRADELSDDELRMAIDSYKSNLAETQITRSSKLPVSNSLVSSNMGGSERKFATFDDFDSTSPTSYETVPYEPIADVVDEPRGAWIPDGWGMYYAVDDFLYRVSYGFVTILNLTIMLGFLMVAGVVFSAWQVSQSAERQQRPKYKSMSSSPQRDRKSTVPELTAPVSTPNSNAIDSPFPSDAEQTPENATSDQKALEPAASVSADSNASARAADSKKMATPYDRAIELIDKPDWPAAMLELQRLEDSSEPGVKPMATLLKIELLMRERTPEAMELARQSMMDCKFEGHELNFDLLVTRWVLTCSADDRLRFLRESASLPPEARARMVNWAKVRSGSSSVLLESELESNAPRTPNGLCDRLFLASCQFNAGKSDQTLRELLNVQQKLRSLSTRELDRSETWLLESSKTLLAEKVDEIVTAISRKQIN